MRGHKSPKTGRKSRTLLRILEGQRRKKREREKAMKILVRVSFEKEEEISQMIKKDTKRWNDNMTKLFNSKRRKHETRNFVESY